MKKYKLDIDLLPKGAWGNNLSKSLQKKDWDILRHECYKKAGGKCEVCGYVTNELDAHEVWDFDIRTKTQTLMRIIALCSKCHGVKHFRNSERLGRGENSKRHFLKINNCSELDFAAHCFESEQLYNERNKVYRWNMKVDFDKFGGKGIKLKERYTPLIFSDYAEKQVPQCDNFVVDSKGYCFPPKVRVLEIDNYQGTITIECDYTKRIEWCCNDIKIKTKYNTAGRFKTTFSVNDCDKPYVQFKLIGDDGTVTSKPFYLVL